LADDFFVSVVKLVEGVLIDVAMSEGDLEMDLRFGRFGLGVIQLCYESGLISALAPRFSDVRAKPTAMISSPVLLARTSDRLEIS
jgi:hypothetical protein